MKSEKSFAGFLLCLYGCCLTLTTSCNDLERVRWSHFEDVSPEGWTSLPALTFEPDSAVNSKDLYDIILYLRFYPHRTGKTVSLLCEEESLDCDTATAKEITLLLHDKEGKPMGRGNAGIYEITDTLAHNVRIAPKWTLSITPLQESVKGISDVGVKIESAK